MTPSTDGTTSKTSLPSPLVLLFYIGATATLVGSYWDDGWHTERGRDSFFIAPHIALYAGVLLSGGALALWGLLEARGAGLRSVLRNRPLLLGLLGAGITLASGPIDNVWHVAFGRDAVIWSPPHMLGIVGIFTMATAVMVELAASGRRLLTSLAGAAVLATTVFVVVEYETDVPQFATTWYLPVLAVAGALALALVQRVDDDRWAATRAALAYTAVIAGISLFLTAAGFQWPLAPLLFLPAAALDLARARRASAAIGAFAFTAVLFLAYVPYASLGIGPVGIEFEASDVYIGFPVSFLLVLAILLLTRPGLTVPVRVAALTVGLALALAVPASALAHDPGQGDDAGTLDMRVTIADGTATLEAMLAPAQCDQIEPVAVVARRGGQTLRAPLERNGCLVSGQIGLPEPGRWFLYAELDRGGVALEAWLPVTAASGEQATNAESGRYLYVAETEPTTTAKVVASVVMYLIVIGLLVAVLRLVVGSQPRGGAAAEPAAP